MAQNVLLKLALAERRGVGADDDQLGLSSPEGLEGAAVSEGNATTLDDKGELNQIICQSGCFARLFGVVLKRTLAPMDCASDLDFLGAMMMDLSEDG